MKAVVTLGGCDKTPADEGLDLFWEQLESDDSDTSTLALPEVSGTDRGGGNRPDRVHCRSVAARLEYSPTIAIIAYMQRAFGLCGQIGFPAARQYRKHDRPSGKKFEAAASLVEGHSF